MRVHSVTAHCLLDLMLAEGSGQGSDSNHILG